jgi:23S rRNA (uracil1939-C5)-methyltransferase
MEGRGIAHDETGKVHFVDGGITGELVVAELVKSKPSYSRSVVTQVLRAASTRVEPRCPHFGVCGGCAMQHIEADAQVATKARALEDLLARLGGQRDYTVMPPLFGTFWRYRHRARLSTRYVEKKGGMLVGFHEKASTYVADLNQCHILPKHVSDLIPTIARFLEALSVSRRIPQIELAVGDSCTAMVLRHLEPLSSSDLASLKEFGIEHKIDWWLQPEGPSSAHRLNEHDVEMPPVVLAYQIPSFGIRMHFKPTDFTQVNHLINDSMVSKAVSLLELKQDEKVLDLFCGLGNFSLPLATRSAYVKGFEGSDDLVKRAGQNAEANGLSGKVEFHVRNLFEVTPPEWESWGHYEKVLIDPPRDGAIEICKAIVGSKPEFWPKRIVYVSCNPATLARDTGILCGAGPYRLLQAGVINMFPHTAHVESIALFELKTL